jgi:Uma2 family endonuclease
MAMEPARHLFTVDEYEAMGAAGLFPPDQRLELIEGEVIEMAAVGPVHASVVNRLNRLLVRACGDRAIVSVQNPLRLSDLSEPQPDLSVLRAHSDFYSSAHPRPPDTLLAVEVCDTTLSWDRRVKVPLYARAGVGELWLADVNAASLEVHRGPGPDRYAVTARLGRGQRVAVDLLEGVELDLEDIFGAAPA